MGTKNYIINIGIYIINTINLLNVPGAHWDGSALQTAGGIRPCAPAGRWRPSLP